MRRPPWRKLLSREGVDLTTISGIDEVFFRHVRYFSRSRREQFFTYFERKNFTHYIAVDPQELGRYLYRKFFGTPAVIRQHYRTGVHLLAHIRRATRGWEGRLNTSAPMRRMVAAYREFRRQFAVVNHLYSITSWLAIEAWQKDFEQLIGNLIAQRHLEGRTNEIVASLSRPWKTTAISAMQGKLRRGASPEDLAAQYQFLRSWAVVWYRPIDAAWVSGMKLQSARKPGRLLSDAAVLGLLQPSAVQRKLLTLAPFLTFFKDWRDDVRREHAYRWSFLFTAIARQFDTDVVNLGYLTLDEIDQALRTRTLPMATIERRKVRPCVVVFAGQPAGIRVLDAAIPRRYVVVRRQVETQTKHVSVKGLIVRTGLATGKAVIVQTYHDIKRVGAGDILIANTTHPNYLPGMRKAAAFVTNEGGIVSHAAIVAREMGKPCIVGTRMATKVFKDGDRVEVDANRGVVRLVEKV